MRSKFACGYSRSVYSILIRISSPLENILISNNYTDHLKFLLAALQDANPHARALGYLIARSLLGRLSGEHQIDAAHEVLQVMHLEELSGAEDFLQRSDNVDDVSSFFFRLSI